MNPQVPQWALLELVQDLEDAACDFGQDPNSPTNEATFSVASEKLRRAVEMVYE